LIGNLVWLILLITSLIQWLRLQKFNPITISICLIVMLGSPFLIGQSREYQLDFPNTTMILFTLWQLEALFKKENTANTIWVGIALGVGAMVK